jgi:hypothetical protein
MDRITSLEAIILSLDDFQAFLPHRHRGVGVGHGQVIPVANQQVQKTVAPRPACVVPIWPLSPETRSPKEHATASHTEGL